VCQSPGRNAKAGTTFAIPIVMFAPTGGPQRRQDASPVGVLGWKQQSRVPLAVGRRVQEFHRPVEQAQNSLS
jgi:hypothetical protein